LTIVVGMHAGPSFMPKVLLLLVESPSWSGGVPHELVSPSLLDGKELKDRIMDFFNGCTGCYRTRFSSCRSPFLIFQGILTTW